MPPHPRRAAFVQTFSRPAAALPRRTDRNRHLSIRASVPGRCGRARLRQYHECALSSPGVAADRDGPGYRGVVGIRAGRLDDRHALEGVFHPRLNLRWLERSRCLHDHRLASIGRDGSQSRHGAGGREPCRASGAEGRRDNLYDSVGASAVERPSGRCRRAPRRREHRYDDRCRQQRSSRRNVLGFGSSSAATPM